MNAKGGIAERADRLVAILVMTGLADLLRPPGPDPAHARRCSPWPAPSPSYSGCSGARARPAAPRDAEPRPWRRAPPRGRGGRRTAPPLGYLAGWRLVRLLPGAPGPRALRAGRRRDLPARRHRRAAAARATSPGSRPSSTTPPWSALTRDAVRSYLRYWCESFRLPSWPVDDVVARTRTVDEHLVHDRYAEGRGRGRAAAAHGQLGLGRGLGLRRRRAAGARWPSGCAPSGSTTSSWPTARTLGHADPAAHRGRRRPAPAGGVGPRGRPGLPARRPRPLPHRRRGRALRAARPDAAGTGRSSRCGPVPRWCR